MFINICVAVNSAMGFFPLSILSMTKKYISSGYSDYNNYSIIQAADSIRRL